MSFKRGDLIVFRDGPKGNWYNGEVIQLYPDFPKAIRVKRENKTEEVLADASMVRPRVEHEALLEEVRRQKARAQYADVIKAWDSGAHAIVDLAKALGVSPVTAYQRLTAAKRRNLIRV